MYNELKEYTGKIKSYHMPGHKSGSIQPMFSFYDVDVTEVEGTDDLYHPEGMISHTQVMISQIYGSFKSYMLVNGSSVGILAGIGATTMPGDTILIARNCHKAVYNAVLINRLKVEYVYPSYDEVEGFAGRIFPQDIERIMKKNPYIRVVVITSPTFEGLTSDIHGISSVVHKNEGILIVDEAHGAHFTFSKELPNSSMELGADIVIQSTHKTLPCLTQTALLHTNGTRINNHKVQKLLGIYQTSSPSYVLMCSIEKGIEYMDTHRGELEEHILFLKGLMENIKIPFGQWLYEKESSKGKESMVDITRLVFLIEDGYITGWEVNRRLRQDYNIQVEMAGKNHIVAISTIGDTKEELKHLFLSLRCILESACGNEDQLNHIEFLKQPNRFYEIYEAFYMHEKKVSLHESVGMISKEFIIPYPPGIPVLAPGEEISSEIIEYLLILLKEGITVYGIIEGEILVIENKL